MEGKGAREGMNAPRPESASLTELRGIGARLDVLDREHRQREEQDAVARAEKALAQERARASLEFDFAGWKSHGEAPVWALGYYDAGTFRIVPGQSRTALREHWFPLLLKQGMTPYITRAWLGRWVAVQPGAY